jgi:hypothetical protein
MALKINPANGITTLAIKISMEFYDIFASRCVLTASTVYVIRCGCAGVGKLSAPTSTAFELDSSSASTSFILVGLEMAFDCSEPVRFSYFISWYVCLVS